MSQGVLHHWLQHTLFEQVPCNIAVIDRDYNIIQANRNFHQTYGEWRGRACYRVYKGREKPCTSCKAAETFRDGLHHVSEEEGVTQEGQHCFYLVQMSPVTNEAGETLYVIEMSTDITQVKELEGALRQAHDFQENLIQNSLDAILATNAQGQLVIFNRAAEELLGYAAFEVLKRRDIRSFLPQEFLTLLNEDTGEGTCLLPETSLVARDGERIPVRFSGVVLYSGEERVGSACFYQDLRPLKRLEREKMQAERLATVGQTVAGLAHGIKNILTGLQGGIFIGQTGFEEERPAMIAQGWDMVRRNTQKISAITTNLLSYSKERTPEYNTLQANKMVLEVVELYEGKAQQNNVSFVLDLSPRLPPLEADAQGIHTCLTNLISNAVDACVADTSKERHQVVLRTWEQEGVVFFSIKDDGTGISPKDRQHLFREFYSTKGTGGTGLGLLVTRKIVHEHEGELTFESTEGEGTTFSFSLPCSTKRGS
jgi:PAS domain S-box-containing protein